VPRGFSGKNNDGDPLQYILIRLCPMLAVSCFLIAVVVGQKSPHGSISSDISELASEDLMQLKVTSATNKEQSLSTVGAVLYVITREDIASSGANNIPDLLRLVPGVQVAQINSNQWAISIRGFNSFSSNKVLALIDGRALCRPLFSGVLWVSQDLPLEDTDMLAVFSEPRPSQSVINSPNRNALGDVTGTWRHTLEGGYASGFFQDEIRLSKSLFLTPGSKLEHDDYTGFEYEPGASTGMDPLGEAYLVDLRLEGDPSARPSGFRSPLQFGHYSD
jgi:hypothetical protein